MVYQSVEHAYQAAKSNNVSIRQEIQKLETPGLAKKFSQTMVVRPEWNTELKLRTMENLVRQKFFFTEPLLTQVFLSTEDAELIEGNTWGDTFWGVCNGVGNNYLGKILMKVRSELYQLRKDCFAIREVHPNISSTELALLLNISQREMYLRTCSFLINQSPEL